MISEIVHLEETATEEEVLNELNRLNNDDSVVVFWYKYHYQNKLANRKY